MQASNNSRNHCGRSKTGVKKNGRYRFPPMRARFSPSRIHVTSDRISASSPAAKYASRERLDRCLSLHRERNEVAAFQAAEAERYTLKHEAIPRS
jgi:hypothetical protein